MFARRCTRIRSPCIRVLHKRCWFNVLFQFLSHPLHFHFETKTWHNKHFNMITQWAHAEAARGEQACKSFLLKQRHCLLSLWRRRRRRRRRRIHNCLVKRLQGGRRHAFIIAVITIPEPYPERAVRIHPKHCALSASGSTDHTIIFAEHLAYVGTCIVNTSVFFYTKKNKSSIKGWGWSGIRCHDV